MLKLNGTFTFYQIQHKGNDVANLMSPWTQSDLDHFKCEACVREAMKAPGSCWDLFGEYGCLDRVFALDCLAHVAARNPGYTFRVVRVNMTQEMEQIAQVGNGPVTAGARV